MVIFIPPTCNINTYAVCIGSYRSLSTIGTSIVSFTLEQNNFMTKFISLTMFYRQISSMVNESNFTYQSF